MNYLENNLALLKERHGALIAYATQQDEAGNIVAERSQSGLPTARVMGRAGKARFLHSPIDPALEAKNLLKDFSFKEENGTVVSGFGLGYLAKEIVARKDKKHVLYLLEAMPELFGLAMRHVDLSDILRDKNTRLFIGNGMFEVVNALGAIKAKAITGRIDTLAVPALKELCLDQYVAIEQAIDKAITSLQAGFFTFENSKYDYMTNSFKNIPSLLQSVSMDRLQGFLKGKPAMVIAAGPSLTDDMERIKKISKDVFTISVDAALKPLLARDIVPDLVATCDPLKLNFKKVEDLPWEKIAHIPLAYRAEASHRVVNHFQGPKFITPSHNSVSNWIVGMGHNTKSFPGYQTVSHLAFFIARLMEADPIVFVGLDLSFPDNRGHVEGCADTWKPDFNDKKMMLVPSNGGGMVKTIPVFKSMIGFMDNEIRRTSSRCINVSREGARIEGVPWMPLEKVFETGCQGDKPVKPKLPPSLLWGDSVTKVQMQQNFKEAMGWMVEEIRSLSDLGERSRMLADTLSVNPLERHRFADRWKRVLGPHGTHEKSVNIMLDYLSRYVMMDREKLFVPEQEETYDAAAFIDGLKVFFGDLTHILPLFNSHCIEALQTLQENESL